MTKTPVATKAAHRKTVHGAMTSKLERGRYQAMRRTSQWAKVALLVGLVVMLSGGLVLAGALPASAAKRAVMISPYGTGTPFDALAYSGLQDAARDFGLEVTLIEATDLSEYETQLVAAAEMGYDIILALHDYFAEWAVWTIQLSSSSWQASKRA